MLAVTFEERDVLPTIDDANKEEMLTMSPKENVVLMNAYVKYVELTMNKTTDQEAVDAEISMMSYKNLINDGQEDIQKTNLMYKRGTKKDTKRLVVSAITSKRGERGA